MSIKNNDSVEPAVWIAEPDADGAPDRALYDFLVAAAEAAGVAIRPMPTIGPDPGPDGTFNANSARLTDYVHELARRVTAMIVAIQPNTHLSPSVASQLTCAQVTGKPILVIAGNREQARGWQELYPSFKCIGGDSESNMRQAITEFAESLRQAPDQPSGGGQ